jgi:hypothetical protein
MIFEYYDDIKFDDCPKCASVGCWKLQRCKSEFKKVEFFELDDIMIGLRKKFIID